MHHPQDNDEWSTSIEDQHQHQPIKKISVGLSSTTSHKPDVSTTSTLSAPRNVKDLRESPGYTNVSIFTYEEMRIATKRFRPDLILGEGGFGVVYKGVIDESVKPGCKATQVAIKELNREGFQGVGCTLTWSRRMKIALDAAKGLAFLHGAERPIIYRDFKTSNILLDADFNAKLSDFGLAKEGPMGDQTHVSTRVMGTYGYAAPEYVMTGHLTARSDVYGFGVVLLEMLIGRRAMDKSRPSREHNLVEWARPLLNHNKKLLRILDPRLEGQYSVKTAMKVAQLAYQCLSQNPKGRPLMCQVVEILETFQEKEENQEEAMFQSGGSCITLYEAPKETPEADKRNQRTSSDGRRAEEKDMQRVDGQDRGKAGNGSGKSESPNNLEFYTCIPEPNSEDDKKSASTRS
ncbi:hypothetical protein FEM48_Zijuj05G0005600 [Ziziphus jujuba var. spinosa]|uniref:Protein kinase domain-containing protein n=1 Tax=Ziziphus jujuba var. spinosa TaxID=714518 RepID=A0A978VBR8_ZIZJJ|nr:hypothetical protein FEM48_Zijuj05G0005600 [Ziziphus jujuba var. spinosa]